jgi:tetratricopeptide (TPR) repeat protein
MSVAAIAQQLKQTDKLMDLAVRGGSAYQGIAKQPKPAELSDGDFAQRIGDEQNQARPAYEYLETAAYNVIATDDNPRVRMAHIEKFMPAFPGSRFEEQVMQLGVYTLSQMNELTRLAAFADKAVAANPNSASTYVLLANAFAESPNLAHTDKAEAYAHKAIELAKRNGDPAAAKQQKLWAGMAHSALGFALLRQEKTVPGIAELKTASEMVKEDTDAYSTVLYRLGFAYAKTNKLAEAKAVLTEAVQVKGPAQELSRELLTKVEAAAKRKGTAGR